MTVAKLQARTITSITAIIRKILWGKLSKERYLSFIGWNKVCANLEDGGLEIRDIKWFNEALLLKLVWQIAANHDKLWIQIFKAKYYPRKGFWGGNNIRGCSEISKAIQKLKPFFEDEIMWHIGDGKGINAVNQPWFDGWSPQRMNTNERRDAKVTDLLDPVTGNWDAIVIRTLLGPLAVQAIENTASKPFTQPLIVDRLIWLSSKKGTYTTKEGYTKLSQQLQATPDYTEAQLRAWKRIWGNKVIIPRVKSFLWRAVHNGLPTMARLNSSIRPVNPVCPRCGIENEYLMHTLFFCPVSRATWWASKLSLRVDHLPLSFPQTLLQVTDAMDMDQTVVFANTAWCIWRARNEAIYATMKATPLSILIKVKLMHVTVQGIASQSQQGAEEMG